MNIMHRLCDRPDWIAPFPGRAHHASWCSDVTHPDMRLIAAAPDLLKALEDCVAVMDRELAGLKVIQPELSAARAAIAKATGEPQ